MILAVKVVLNPIQPTIDDRHCDRIHSSLIAVWCFDNGYVGKQPVAWKEYCVEYWLEELQESMGRCTCCHDITEKLVKTALNTIQSTIKSMFSSNRRMNSVAMTSINAREKFKI